MYFQRKLQSKFLLPCFSLSFITLCLFYFVCNQVWYVFEFVIFSRIFFLLMFTLLILSYPSFSSIFFFSFLFLCSYVNFYMISILWVMRSSWFAKFFTLQKDLHKPCSRRMRLSSRAPTTVKRPRKATRTAHSFVHSKNDFCGTFLLKGLTDFSSTC